MKTSAGNGPNKIARGRGVPTDIRGVARLFGGRPMGLLLAAILCATALSACTGQTGEGSGSEAGVEGFSMEGTWSTDDARRIDPEDGPSTISVTLEIDETEGRAFEGELSTRVPTGELSRPFVGSMTPDGNVVVLADDDGYSDISVVDKNTIDLCYTEVGVDRYVASCGRYTRE